MWQNPISNDLSARAHVPSLGLRMTYAESLCEAKALRDRGLEPVECSFGPDSVVGPLRLDHHGAMAGEEPVSIKAAKLVTETGFVAPTEWVVAGTPDPDAVYALLVLSGVIAPSLELATGLAELDLDPIGIDRTKEPYLRNAAFDMGGPFFADDASFRRAVLIGQAVFQPEPLSGEFRDQVLSFEERNVADAAAEIQRVEGSVAFVISDSPNRYVWHRSAPLVVQYKPTSEILTVSGCSRAAAARLSCPSVFDLLGSAGFTPFYGIMDSVLNSQGSGGRPDIGGSPRGFECRKEDSMAVFEELTRFSMKR